MIQIKSEETKDNKKLLQTINILETFLKIVTTANPFLLSSLEAVRWAGAAAWGGYPRARSGA